ncbi:MAG: hypothetical protein ABSC19_10350 [Syntrophorhabdales bacterium]
MFIEQTWAENRLTVEGRIMHEHVHEEGHESRGDVRIATVVPSSVLAARPRRRCRCDRVPPERQKYLAAFSG